MFTHDFEAEFWRLSRIVSSRCLYQVGLVATTVLAMFDKHVFMSKAAECMIETHVQWLQFIRAYNDVAAKVFANDS